MRLNFFSTDFSLSVDPTIFNTQISVQSLYMIKITSLLGHDIILKNCQFNLLAIDPLSKSSATYISGNFVGTLQYKDSLFDVNFSDHSSDTLAISGSIHAKKILEFSKIAQDLFENGMESLITMQMRKGTVPVRLVPKGEERFPYMHL